MASRWIEVNDLMQQGYRYKLTEPSGRNFHFSFRPQLTPAQMLALGVFGGRYMTDCADEFPEDWFDDAKLCKEKHDPKLNFFGINPIKALLWAGIVQGFSTPFLMLLIMLLTSNRKVMGRWVNTKATNALGWTTTVLIFAALVGLVVTWVR